MLLYKYNRYNRCNLPRIVALCCLLWLTGCGIQLELPPLPGLSSEEPPTGAEVTPEAPEGVVARRQSATPVPPTPTRDPTLPTPTPLPEIAPQATISPDFSPAVNDQEALLTELYRRASPAVVSIEITIDLANSLNLPADTPLPEGRVPTSSGSGWLFNSQGYIVTNNHVVADAEALQVIFHDGSKARADVVGTDPGSDLAVIKVDQLPAETAPLPIGDSDAVEVGQMAIAIGNPFGLQNTLTVGVISGLGRSLIGPPGGGGFFSIPNIIQSDAAINPGNSGGPLLNARGEVIGVNTAIATESGVFDGVGYAVPAQVVERIVPALIEDGSYEHPWIGISMVAVDPLMAEEVGLDVESGVLVTGVVAGSPADKAGIREGTENVVYAGGDLPIDGDIIVAVNNREMRNSDELLSFLQLDAAVGDTLTFTVVRDGSEEQFDLTLVPRP